MTLSLELKKRLVNLAVATFAGSGLFALTLGSVNCFVGLSGAAIIKLGEVFTKQHRTLKVMMFYGSAGMGSGLFLIGFGMAIADTIGEKIIEEEIAIELSTVSSLVERPFASDFCIGCKNYHGGIYNGVRLVCAIHPHGPEDKCPDWLGYAEKN